MLSKKNRLTKKGSFSYVYRKGESRLDKALVLVFIKSKGTARVGFSVSNKIGKATKRNKIKRRLRACVRSFISDIAPCQMVFVAKTPILEMTYDEIYKLTGRLLQKAGLITTHEK